MSPEASRVAINGFGRIGRLFLKRHEQEPQGTRAIEVVAINDLIDAQTAAVLLRRDSVHGKFDGKVEVKDGRTLVVNGREIPILNQADPRELPWGDMGVHTVVESTGRFATRGGLCKHIEAGAKRAILSQPGETSEDVDITVVRGINDGEIRPEHILVSIASCTTNCLAPMAKVLDELAEIVDGDATTTHAYTGDQRLVDAPHKDPRRARAAATNMVPTTTGASRAVGLVLPRLKGKLDGLSIRVPLADGSLVELNATVTKPTSVEEVNQALRRAAEGTLSGIMEFSMEPLVSGDVIGNPHSAVVDSLLTRVRNGTKVKVLGWYDNEWAYANRLWETARQVATQRP